jgi:hypothetical protein
MTVPSLLTSLADQQNQVYSKIETLTNRNPAIHSLYYVSPQTVSHLQLACVRMHTRT